MKERSNFKYTQKRYVERLQKEKRKVRLYDLGKVIQGQFYT